MEVDQIENIKLLISFLGIFLGITLGFFLLINESAKNSANRYLGVLLLVITLFFLPNFFALTGLLATFHYIIGIPRIIPFLFGPLTYLYVRSCTQKNFEMRPILWLHFIPAVLMLLNCWPELSASATEKLANQARFAQEGTVMDYTWIWLMKVIHPLIYFGLSIQLILLYRKHVSNSASSIDTAFHRWLLTFIFILSVPILGLLAFVFTEFGAFSIIGLALGLLTFLIAIYIATLVKPELFHAFPHQMPIPSSKEVQRQKYEHSNLQATQKEKYLTKLKKFMATDTPHLSPELTLAQLAEQVNIPSYYLSQVINEKLDCNFLDFINGYRIETAKALLIDDKFSHYTIVSIAYEAGFNSKSTFYTAFKKVVGRTPSQYRKDKVAA